MLVKTLKRHRYATQIHVPGEEYEINKVKDAKLLEAVGRVRRVPDKVSAPLKEEAKPVEKKTASKKTASKKTAKGKAEKSTGGSSYKRKDMVAE